MTSLKHVSLATVASLKICHELRFVSRSFKPYNNVKNRVWTRPWAVMSRGKASSPRMCTVWWSTLTYSYTSGSLLYSLSLHQLVRVHVVIPPQLLSTYRPIAVLNELEHIPHQPSSSLLAYHIDNDHSVSFNPRLVRVHVAIVRRCNLLDCIPHPSDNHVEGSDV